MKLFIINLDRAPERMARIARLLDGMAVSFERVPAVDGKLLPPPAAEAPDDAFLLSRTEMALNASHERCWDLFEQSEDSACVIIEDDVHFGRDFARFMNGGASLPADFDLIKIETTPNKVWLNRGAFAPSQNRRFVPLLSPHLGSAGYVLSRSGLAKLRRLAKGPRKPIDILLFGHPGQELTIYQAAPALVIQDNALKGDRASYVGLVSDIDRGRKPKIRGLKKVMREMARPFRPYWPPGPLSQKWRLSYRKVEFE